VWPLSTFIGTISYLHVSLCLLVLFVYVSGCPCGLDRWCIITLVQVVFAYTYENFLIHLDLETVIYYCVMPPFYFLQVLKDIIIEIDVLINLKSWKYKSFTLYLLKVFITPVRSYSAFVLSNIYKNCYQVEYIWHINNEFSKETMSNFFSF